MSDVTARRCEVCNGYGLVFVGGDGKLRADQNDARLRNAEDFLRSLTPVADQGVELA